MKRLIRFSLSAAFIAVLAGCNSGSTFNVQNPPPPPQSNLTIAFMPAPATSIEVGFSTNFTAVVSNDPMNYGVDWTLVCPSSVGAGNCGTLSLTHTTCQGTTCGSTTYTPPSPIAGNSETVSIVAYATANHSVNTVATLTVNTFDSSLQAGNYVLQVQGIQGGLPYQFVGVIAVDGQGNITGGEQTTNFADVPESATDSVPSGGYFIGNDGRGTITLNPANNFGQEIFSIVLLNDSQNPRALVSQTGIDSTGATATGTLELQTSTSAPGAGSYAFVTAGTAAQLNFVLPIAIGGILNIDSSNNLSGLGDETFGRELILDGATLCATPPCMISGPDAFGQIILNLTPGFGFHNHPVNFQLTGYTVDATHVRLVETDYATNPEPFGLTGGLAIAQSAGSTNNFRTSSLTGSYVYEFTGVDLSANNPTQTPTSLTAVGQFEADGNQNLTQGFTDTFLLFNTNQATQNNPQSGAQISASFDGTYSVDPTGRATLNLTGFSPAPRHGYAPILIFYLTDSQNPAPALVVQTETTYYPSVGSGIAYPQSTATFTGDYGFSFTQVDQSAQETDGTAQMKANAANTPAVSGVADSTLASPQDPNPPDHAFTGTFASPQSDGIFAGSFLDALGTFVPFAVGNNTNSNFAVDYYAIDQDHGFFIETDLVNSVPPSTPPVPSGQVSFGYYLGRTPLCDACP